MQNQLQNQNIWVDIQEYSRIRSMSISTIRRRIKCNQVKYRVNDGKYLLEVESNELRKEKEMGATELTLRLEVQRLKMVCDKQNEELEELRMLTEVLEKRLNAQNEQTLKRNFPQLPKIPVEARNG